VEEAEYSLKEMKYKKIYGESKSTPRQLILQPSLSRNGKNSVKNAYIRIVIRVSTKIEGLLLV